MGCASSSLARAPGRLWTWAMANADKPSAGDRPLFTITGHGITLYSVGLAVAGFISCVAISLAKDFKRSTATHCGVANYLPSISAAIGGYTPQKYIWRICIALHIAPRLVVCIMYYNYYRRYPSVRGIYQLAVRVAALCHFLENMSLVTLSYVSSTENYDIHESSFYLFLVFSQMYMLLTIILFRRAHAGHWTVRSLKSYTYKLYLWLSNVASLIGAGYFFYRHNTYCEPGVYSLFALCEYSVTLTNMGFHGAMLIYDFGNVRFTAHQLHTTGYHELPMYRL